ncbi:MAG TPA: hypothetical protein VNT79_12800 [Phycisphaerae bacterium]|nr:hypothetical protein [Phycisphaerae bacterium]
MLNAKRAPISIAATMPSGEPVVEEEGDPRGPGNLVTGFESAGPPLLFNLGSVEPQNGWAATGTNLLWQRISNVHPATGTQHMRFIRNTGAAGGVPQEMFSNTLPAVPAGPVVMTLDVAISNLDGADYFVQPQAAGQGFLTTRVRFSFQDADANGGPDIWVLDATPGIVEVNTGDNWIPGNTYRSLRIEMVPSANQIKYFYNGTLIHTGNVVAGTMIDNVFFFHDNFQLANEFGDFDNLSVTSLTGNGSCCNLVAGTCANTTAPAQCVDPNNVYTHGQTCVQTGCAIATGACCTMTGCLENQTIPQCDAAGGTFAGDDTVCATGCPGPFCQAAGDGQLPDFTFAVVSDANPNTVFRAADNFTPVANSSVTTVRWWGIYVDFPSTICEGVSDDFDITFFDDASNRPDDIIAGPMAVAPTRTTITQTFNGGPIFEYQVTIPAVPVTANNCFWMEIRNNTVGDCVWLWLSSDVGDGISAQDDDALPYDVGSNSDPDLAWCLNINVNSDGCESATTSPGSCCLADGSCLEGQTEAQCEGAGGVFGGSESTCASNPCPLICQPGGEGQITDFDGHGAEFIVGSTSDGGITGLRVADNFTPSQANTIQSVRWWGFYFNGAAPCTPQNGDAPDDFTLTFFNDGGGIPGTILSGPTPVTPAKFDTLLDIATTVGSHRVFQYTATGLSVPVSGDTCYWLEVVNNTTGDCAWSWSTAPAGDDLSAQHNGAGAYAVADQNDFDMAWCLNGFVNPDGCLSATPIPGGCCLGNGASCEVQTAGECNVNGGDFLGVDSACGANACAGACCVGPEADECQFLTEAACGTAGGTFYEIGMTCDESPCRGACCSPEGFCSVEERNACLVIFAGSYHGGEVCPDGTGDEFICASNSACAPTELTCPQSVNFDNTGQAFAENTSDLSPALSCYGGPDLANTNGSGSVWVSFVGDGSSREINTCGSGVSDTVLAVYTRADGNCGALTAADEVADGCNEDGCGGEDDGDFNARVCIPTINGQTYWVQVNSFDADSVGDITVNLLCACQAICECPGDVGGAAGAVSDGIRNGRDVQEFTRCMLGTGTNCGCADADGDGSIDPFGPTGDIAAFANILVTQTGACPP